MSPTLTKRIANHLAGFAVAGIALAGLTLVRPAAAQEDSSPWKTRQTTVTFNGPVALPNTTLPAGTYVFQYVQPLQTQELVGVYDSTGRHLIDLEQVAPADRGRIESKPAVIFEESPASHPAAVREIFAADHEYGYEFIYQHHR